MLSPRQELTIPTLLETAPTSLEIAIFHQEAASTLGKTNVPAKAPDLREETILMAPGIKAIALSLETVTPPQERIAIIHQETRIATLPETATI